MDSKQIIPLNGGIICSKKVPTAVRQLTKLSVSLRNKVQYLQIVCPLYIKFRHIHEAAGKI